MNLFNKFSHTGFKKYKCIISPFFLSKIDHRISTCDMQVSAFEGGLYLFLPEFGL